MVLRNTRGKTSGNSADGDDVCQGVSTKPIYSLHATGVFSSCKEIQYWSHPYRYHGYRESGMILPMVVSDGVPKGAAPARGRGIETEQVGTVVAPGEGKR